VVLPTPPLSAPTTITTGFAMIFPYAQFLIEHHPRTNGARPSGKARDRPRIMPFEPHWSDPNAPEPCFGREHGRNKGEFNLLGCR
jgi:hypothetical protein